MSTTFEERRDAATRTPVTLAVLTMDRCLRTFGLSPCAATGEPCYYTYTTCGDRANYLRGTKEYYFSDAPASFHGPRPYVDSVRYSPTEIKGGFTETSRCRIRMNDEPDGDVGTDPHVEERAEAGGEYFLKFMARNRNYRRRPVRVMEGFDGLPLSEYRQTFTGRLDNVELHPVSFEAVDLLKDISEVEVPAKISAKLAASIGTGDSTLTLDIEDIGEVPAPAGGETLYLTIDKELMGYTGVLTGSKQLTGLTRGEVNTEAAAHEEGAAVSLVRHYRGNPFEVLRDEMLIQDAGVDAGSIDAEAFDTYRDFPDRDPEVDAFVVKPTKLEELYFDLVGFLDAESWVNEEGKYTVKRNLPNEPGKTYPLLTDDANIVAGTVKVDLNEESRYTRTVVYWDVGDVFGDLKDPATYASPPHIAADEDAESAEEYGDMRELVFYCRWLSRRAATDEELADYLDAFAHRQTWRRRDAAWKLSFSVELKDQWIRTGDWVRLSTRDVLTPGGRPIEREKFQVVRRERKGGLIELTLRQVMRRRIFFVAPDDTPDIDSASEDEREWRGFISADEESDENRIYRIW